MSHQSLQLVHHVVVDHLVLVLLHFFGLTIIHAQQVVAEGRHHEELLHHAIHVADAAQVAQADVPLSALARLGDVRPASWLLNRRDQG